MRWTSEQGGGAPVDWAATLTITAVVVAALLTAWTLPWWVMKAQAPQYGQRTLVVEIGPRTVEGDVRELDLLGHYVGIRPLGALARLERILAPFGLAAAVAGVLVAPWLKPRWLRLLAVAPVLVMPIVMPIDLGLWMKRAVNQRDPGAALSMTVKNIEPKLLGAYEVGQFKVATELGAGFYLDVMAAALALGLVFARPLPVPARLRRQRLIAAFTTAGLAAAMLMPASAGARDDEAFAPSLADAVAAARDGDTVIVPAGVHRARLVIDKRIRLVGRPGAVIDGAEEGTVLRISASGAEVRGVTIRGSGTSYTAEDAGIRIERAADVRIADVRIEDVLFGVFVVQGDRCVIESSTVIGKDLPHVRRGDGIRLWFSSGCRIAGNRVERSRDVVIWYSSGTVVEDNVVRTSRYGLHYMYSNDNVFHRNRFEDNQVGAAIMYSRGIELAENSFSFSEGPSAYGLLVKDADDVFIVGNRFVHDDTALFFDNAPQARDGRVDVRGNLIARSEVGVALQPASRRIRFWDNAFVGNRTHVRVQGGGSASGNEWSVAGRGNHWSGAVLYDRDGDGVSEIPFRVESTYEALADRYPALRFYDATPGAEAIDLAARLFPVFAPRPLLADAHPLVHAPLTAWTHGGGEPRGAMSLGAAGVALLALAGGTLAGARRVLA
ncbi:MAG: nitrous oxide reductase family maturation protein NosD [Thermodesulfobacteriota bacterium]